ncbi:MAG TPA: phosphoribosylanthranilate isomerase [Caulobacteraceae bacterium]|jgi:phosphoribosylanthranilate isomerase
MALAKICGVTTPTGVEAALAGGAAYVGFMFFPTSPRRVSIHEAAELARPARGVAKIVAVTVDADDEQIGALVAGLAPDLVQLHGRETPRRVQAIASRGIGVIKAIGVATESDVDAARAFDGLADHLMFDAKPSAVVGRPGGAGESFDWRLLAGRKWRRPWFLAGGLDPENVAAAVAITGAPMVDVSSGVESRPGLKDAALIARFLTAARQTP